jgi:hypothetical protein
MVMRPPIGIASRALMHRFSSAFSNCPQRRPQACSRHDVQSDLGASGAPDQFHHSGDEPAHVGGLGPGHVDVGEQHADIVASRRDDPGFVGVAGLDRRQAGILQHLDGEQEYERVVLDDEDHRGIEGALGGHGRSTTLPEVGCL